MSIKLLLDVFYLRLRLYMDNTCGRQYCLFCKLILDKQVAKGIEKTLICRSFGFAV